MDKQHPTTPPQDPIPSSPNTTNVFAKRKEVNFRCCELFFLKTVKNEEDEGLQVMFAVDDDFILILDQVEYFLYMQEVFQRVADAENIGKSYIDVCQPEVKYYSTSKQNVPIYLATNLLDNIEELEEEENN